MWTQKLRALYQVSKGCGLSSVVMDRPGHWMEDLNGPGKIRRERFVSFSGLTFDTFTDRVVDAVQILLHPVDEIFSTTDALHTGVEQAAEILGLPMVGSQALKRATNNFNTRQMQKIPFMMLISSVDELYLRHHEDDNKVQYHLIVKSTNSDGHTASLRW
jgi:hypothetical protein